MTRPGPALALYDTMRRRKATFAPLDPANLRMYVCGPTVYDAAHIGNARPVVVFDVLYRLLRRLYGAGRVTYVRNVTDIDDKIIAAAEAAGEPVPAIAARFTRMFHDDAAALGALPPDAEPRATDHVPRMIAMVETLIGAGHAYAVEGHVLFAVATMSAYGRLSRHGRAALIAGARVEVAPYKRDPADFVLWKPSAPDRPGWDSPWGRGRPGWHIECSAMSEFHLGETLDVHGGGQDLIFPHHENEIAQSVCAHGGVPFVRHWVHNGYVTVDGEKMSKSLGNYVTVRDLLRRAPGEAIRFALLSAQYRQPLDFSLAGLRDARAALDRLYAALRNARDSGPAETAEAALDDSPFLAALCDDLNTPRAIAALHELATRLNKETTAAGRARRRAELLAAAELLGLLRQDPERWLQQGAGEGALEPGEIDALVARRAEARRARDFDEADRIRDRLARDGVTLEDTPRGTSWRRAG